MDAIRALTERVSCGKLAEPAPSGEQREAMYKAALRAADHGLLRPWRFVEFEGDALTELGEVLERAAVSDTPDLGEAERSRFRQMPMRAPLVLVAIASYKDNPKVPEWEQLVSTGAAVQNIINAAFALGVGAYWRTGPLTNHPMVRHGLKIGSHEFVAGFIYLGTPAVTAKSAPDLHVADYFAPWAGK